MKVLLLGGGGREHALAVALSASPALSFLAAMPGNSGIAEIAHCVPTPADRLVPFDGLLSWCQKMAIDLVVIGPEAPLVHGVADCLRKAGILCFGPDAAAARLEGSKKFTKTLCNQAGIPTAAYVYATTEAEALKAVEARGAPVVVKTDGLASGKGVIVAKTSSEAERAVRKLFSQSGDGNTRSRELIEGGVLIEECLQGQEASLFAFCAGSECLLLGTAQDYKRALDGDQGLNTGGMGAISPAPALDGKLESLAMDRIIRPAIRTMAARGTPYFGLLYGGLMVNQDKISLIEFNVRFGDPECQALIPRLKGDFLRSIVAVCEGRLADVDLSLDPRSSACVVIAANGYPDAPKTGMHVQIPDTQSDSQDFVIFHGAMKRENDQLFGNGGRVLSGSALGKTLTDASARVYRNLNRIKIEDTFYRKDIGTQPDKPDPEPVPDFLFSG